MRAHLSLIGIQFGADALGNSGGKRAGGFDLFQQLGLGVFQVVHKALGAQIEFEEAVRRRKEVAEKDCTEVGLAEKSNPTAREKVINMKLQNGGNQKHEFL